MPNVQHRAAHEDTRAIPRLVADYGFLCATWGKLQTTLVMRLYPYGISFACIVPRKGSDPLVVRRVAQVLQSAGLFHFAYRCDKETAINSMIEPACLESGRKGFKVKTDDADTGVQEPEHIDDDLENPGNGKASPSPLVAVPEVTHPGESRSNGLAERAVRTIEEHARTALVALEAHIETPCTT